MTSLLIWLAVLALDIVFAIINPDPVTGGCVGFAFAALLYEGIPSYLHDKRRHSRKV